MTEEQMIEAAIKESLKSQKVLFANPYENLKSLGLSKDELEYIR